jgi:hypothetical protein
MTPEFYGPISLWNLNRLTPITNGELTVPKRKPNFTSFEELTQRLKERPPARWCQDPHRRGRSIPSKKLYKRKPRTPSGAFHFGPDCMEQIPTRQVSAINKTCHAILSR